MRYSNLEAEMGRYEISISMISNTINRSYDTTRKKVKGKSRFKIGESIKIQKKYFPNMALDYLFREFDVIA